MDELTEEEWDEIIYGGEGVDPKKAEAFRNLEEWLNKNPHLFPPDMDYKKEFLEALDEKYGNTD